MMKHILLGLLCALAPLTVPAQGKVSTEAATDVATEVARRLQATKTLAGQFEQRKSLAGFARPLVSRGTFLLVQGKGVLWHTRAPFESWLRVTPQSLSERRGDTLTTVDAGQQPALREMNVLLLAMLAGDTLRLSERFLIEARNEGARWTMRLVPRERALAEHIRVIRLSGTAHVDSVQVEEGSGDRTDIQFSAHDPRPPVGSEEALRLEKGL